MKPTLQLLSFSFLVFVAACSKSRDVSEPACEELIFGVTHIPMKDDIPANGNYYQIVSDIDDSATLKCLVRSVTNERKMPDPRTNFPNLNYDNRIGDTAVYLLWGTHEITYKTILPESLWDKWDNDGVYVYRSYVREPHARTEIQSRLEKHLNLK